MSNKKNPHIDGASDDQIIALLETRSPAIREIYIATHRLVLQTLPDVAYSTDCTDGVTGYGARQYGYDGWGVVALAAHRRWVSLFFFRGTDLQDAADVLEGTGKRVRHVKIHSVEQFDERSDALRALIEEAAGLNVQ